MRKKKGKGPAERLSEMKEHFLFRSINKALPGQLDKLHIVEGDCQVCTLNTVGFILAQTQFFSNHDFIQGDTE